MNYQVCIWRKAHEHYPSVPLPQGFGFHINPDTNKLEPLWFEGAIIPNDFISVLEGEEGGEDHFDFLDINDFDNYDDDEHDDDDDDDDDDDERDVCNDSDF